MALSSDRKLGNNPTSSLVEYYTTEILTASDYDPFGMQLDDRKISSSTYRFGFNGKENDNDVKGEGSQQDYEMRIYDPRVGRFLSVDPLTKSYPWNITYAFAENSPVANIDLDGTEKFHFSLTTGKDGKTILTPTFTEDLVDYVDVSWKSNGKEPKIEKRVNQRK